MKPSSSASRAYSNHGMKCFQLDLFWLNCRSLSPLFYQAIVTMFCVLMLFTVSFPERKLLSNPCSLLQTHRHSAVANGGRPPSYRNTFPLHHNSNQSIPLLSSDFFFICAISNVSSADCNHVLCLYLSLCIPAWSSTSFLECLSVYIFGSECI